MPTSHDSFGIEKGMRRLDMLEELKV